MRVRFKRRIHCFLTPYRAALALVCGLPVKADDTWSYGSLLIDDDLATDTVVVKRISRSCARTKDVAPRWSVGGLLTDRRDATDRETVFGIDSRYQYDDNWIFQSTGSAQSETGSRRCGQPR